MKRITFFVLSFIMTISLIASFSVVSAEEQANTLEQNGAQLLDNLLYSQFESYKTGELIDTSNIFTDSHSTKLYNQYLYWYTGLTDATGEYWTDYSYDLNFKSSDGEILTFTMDLTYGRTCSLFNSEIYGVNYVIRVTENDGSYYIADIDTDEPHYDGFKRQVCDNFVEHCDSNAICAAEAAVPFSVVSNASEVSQSTIDAMINDYVQYKADCADIVVDPSKVTDMEAEHANYLDSHTDEGPVTASTRYSYDGERGRTYADQYYLNGNPSFYKVTDAGMGDCANFTSQCVWAAYGGWTDGDSKDTMDENIKARKRMQSSASLDNWFAHNRGVGNAWGSTTNFWDFATSSPDTGPRATGYNNNKKWAGAFDPWDILTGQILQVRKGSSGKYEHSAYVAGGVNDYFENIIIAQHSPYSRIMLDEFITNWGTNCYVRQLVFSSAYFDS